MHQEGRRAAGCPAAQCNMLARGGQAHRGDLRAGCFSASFKHCTACLVVWQLPEVLVQDGGKGGPVRVCICVGKHVRCPVTARGRERLPEPLQSHERQAEGCQTHVTD